MLMVSFRFRKRVFAGVLAIALVGAAGFVAVRQVEKRNTVPAVIATSEEGAEAGKEAVKPKKNAAAKTNEQRIAFIRAFGWEIEEEPVEVLEVIIPKEFDNVYAQYNQIQKDQGYDLEKLAGKRCKRYSYKITNYPGEENEVRFNLLVRDGKVIGGDVSSMKQNGFMQGFAQSA